jgi:hypothetical protein
MSLPKNATILKLRQHIMKVLNMKGNFVLYSNAKMRDITFAEEEDFSLSDLVCYSEKEVTVEINKVEEH